MKIYKQFQFKLFIMQTVLIISILALFAFISLDRMISQTEIELKSRLISDRINLEEKIKLNLENVENSMSFLLNSNELKKNELEDFDLLVQNIIINTPIITQIYIMDSSGMQIYKSSFKDTLGDRSDRDYFQKAIKGQKTFSDVIVSRSTNESIVVYAVPIKSNGNITGVLGCSVNLDFLSDKLSNFEKSVSISKDMYGFIVDREGTVIAHPNKDFVYQRLDLHYLEPVKRALSGDTGISSYIFENTKKIVSFGKLSKTGWGIFVQIPEKTAFSGIEILEKLTISLLVLLIIVSILTSYFVSNYMKKPVSNILNMISQLEDQRTVIIKKSTRDDEFGVIENSFISMANTIVEDQNQLELRISQRTEELTQAMNELMDAQNKIMITEKMNSLNKFISNLAHEINTPLGNALSSVTFTDSILSELIELIEQGKLSKPLFITKLSNIIEAVDIIKNQVIKSKDLVHIITSLNTNNNSNQNYIPCEKLKLYLKQYEFDLKSILENTNHTLRITLDIPDEFSIVYPEKLLQILKLLITNSLEHAFSEDLIGIIDIVVQKDDKFLYVLYSNNGNTIPENYINHIFEPFFKGNMGSSGKGLGLTIIYALVVQFFEGEISCKNLPTGGVKFDIKIPLVNLNDSCFINPI